MNTLDSFVSITKRPNRSHNAPAKTSSTSARPSAQPYIPSAKFGAPLPRAFGFGAKTYENIANGRQEAHRTPRYADPPGKKSGDAAGGGAMRTDKSSERKEESRKYMEERKKKLAEQGAALVTTDAPQRPQSLTGVVVHLLGYLGPSNTNLALRKLIVEHGGTCNSQTSSSTTHIVGTSLCSSKLHRILRASATPGARYIHVVRPEWIHECVSKGRRVDEEPFLVEGIKAPRKRLTTIDTFFGSKRKSNGSDGAKDGLDAEGDLENVPPNSPQNTGPKV
ncbi:hypothetical protein M427DRAFT_51922 [Gonapodya prolifera JEL478]|uniref:BRCT domain-containing protein n=1 Tax=Gonapodya prolifera (strain JEL478) TaxID=1344416 RepID=A0A139AW67_GONPJ|nr:hypothetical protein M427DRAFT_51922 [Gonapodya prolifera JEL478]|eukprot:KXS20970.1 hypothetical protein M427DRAFT_51922 [Gonapodya prolifera JEL478]